MRFCGQCGSANTETARFCTNCGAKLEEPVQEVNNETYTQPEAEAPQAVQEETTAQAYTAPENTAAQTYTAPEYTAQANTAYTAPQQPASEPAGSAQEGKTSALSIVAFVFSFFIPIAGLVMGIIDLCIGDGRKKGLSIAAVAISACCIAIALVTILAIVVPLSQIF